MTIDPNTYPFKGTLKTHQVPVLSRSQDRRGMCWWVDPGGGKTAMVIAEASDLFERDKIDAVVVFAPNGPHQQWVEEQFPLWCDVDFVAQHNKGKPAQVRGFLDARARRHELKVFAMNFDALRTAKGRAMLEKLWAKHPRVYLAIDESQKVKSMDAQRTQEAMQWAERATFVRLLSGTPMTRGLEDLFSQYHMAQPGSTGFMGYKAFRNYYCRFGPVPGGKAWQKMVIGYQNEDELRRRTSSVTVRVPSSEFMVGDAPDFIPVSTPMTAALRTQYASMKEMLLSLINGNMISVTNALTQLMKLQQLSSGFIYTEDGTTEWVSGHKIDATNTLLENLDEPVIVWSPFKALTERLRDEIDDATVYTQRDDLERWDRVLIANQGSGAGVGLNLQRAAANIYVANTFNAEHRWQSLKRTDRIGQTRQVRVWDLITPDTVEGRVRAKLQDKEDAQSRMIDDVREVLV